MLMLLFVTALALAKPDPVELEAGETVIVTVSANRHMLMYGGYFRAENPRIAEVAGRYPAGGTTGRAHVRGLRPGRTRLILSYVSGMSTWDAAVATIVVSEACDEPVVTPVERELRVAEGQPVRLEVVASGDEPLAIEWHDGETRLGGTNPLTVTLAPGIHRIRVQAANRCGMAADEIRVDVVPSRRRAVRR